MTTRDAQFVGSIPESYEEHLVPVIFEPYARDLVSRIGGRPRGDLLEVASGTGVVTRLLLPQLGPEGRLVATDLNESMLKIARARAPRDPRIEWKEADGTALPFEDGSFDAVYCQFGVMFFPDKAAGMREARRVLRKNGEYLFNVWDGFDRNAFGRIAHETIAGFFPVDPPAFYLTPFGFHDAGVIGSMMRDAGFREVSVEPVPREAVSPSAKSFAEGLVRGNPTIGMIAERGTVSPEVVVDAVARNVEREGGRSPFRSPIQALVVRGVV